jgi:hypothetical protein
MSAASDRPGRQVVEQWHRRRHVGRVRLVLGFPARACHPDTSLGAKYPKKMNRWTNLGRLLTFFKQNRRKLVEFTTTNRPEQTPTSAWWVTTFAVSPAIDAVNFTFVILQSQSLLISQHAEHIHALIATLTTMFGVEME